MDIDMAVIGANPVSWEIIKTLRGVNFPLNEVRVLSAQPNDQIGNDGQMATALDLDELREVNFLVITEEVVGFENDFYKPVIDRGGIVIDGRPSAKRWRTGPLIIPDINIPLLERSRGMIVNPCCLTILSTRIIAPIYRQLKVEKLYIFFRQPLNFDHETFPGVRQAEDALTEEIKTIFGNEDIKFFICFIDEQPHNSGGFYGTFEFETHELIPERTEVVKWFQSQPQMNYIPVVESDLDLDGVPPDILEKLDPSHIHAWVHPLDQSHPHRLVIGSAAISFQVIAMNIAQIAQELLHRGHFRTY